MSRSGKKGGRKSSRRGYSKVDLCDVTLNDFANSSLVYASGRLKKNSIPVNKVVKKVKQLNLVEDNKTWEEKLTNLKISGEVEKGNQSSVVKKASSRKKKRIITSDTHDEGTGKNYPIDIWFLISEYISPENVGKFAAICKTSLEVVSTAKFWFNLYKKYYRSVPNMPEILRPECMTRRYALRPLVIRALHLMYPPFIEKLQPQLFIDGDLHPLVKRLCLLAWSQKIKNHWLFSFKLKQVRSTRYEVRKEPPSLLEMLEDITANHDDNCKVLQVTCLNYTNLPMLSGQILSSASLNVSQRMYKLQLHFGSGPFPNQSGYTVILDPIINFRVLDWWHPSYPHSDDLISSFLSAKSYNQQFDELEF